MKVGFVIITYNIDARVFLLQMKAIKKYCTDEDYEIQVVDNSSDALLADAIQYHANKLELPYRKTFATSNNSTDSHAFAANASYGFFKKDYDYLFFLDHDCIPVKPFSVVDILKDKTIAGLGQGKAITYYWAGCVMFDNNKVDRELINFNPSHELTLDTGGMLYKVIEKVGLDQCVFFNETYHQNNRFNGLRNVYAMLNEGMFMHFIASSGWDGSKENKERVNSLISIAEEKINL